MSRPPPPKLSTRGAAFRGSLELTSDDLARLAQTFARQITEGQRTAFLRMVVSGVAMWQGLDEHDRATAIANETENSGGKKRPRKATESVTVAYSEIRSRIEKMEAAAKALQVALKNLQNEPYDFMKPHFRYLSIGSAPPVQLPAKWRDKKIRFKDVINDVWESLNGLQATGEYTRRFIPSGKQDQPQYNRSRRLIALVVNAYQIQFGKMPSGGKDHWFTKFVSLLCELLPDTDEYGRDISVTGGRDMLSYVIKNIQAQMKK